MVLAVLLEFALPIVRGQPKPKYGPKSFGVLLYEATTLASNCSEVIPFGGEIVTLAAAGHRLPHAPYMESVASFATVRNWPPIGNPLKENDLEVSTPEILPIVLGLSGVT